MLVVKIISFIVRIEVIFIAQAFCYIGYIVYSRGIKISAHHFLETGHIRLVFIDQAEHLCFYFRMRFMLMYAEMLYVPAHYPQGLFLFRYFKMYRKLKIDDMVQRHPCGSKRNNTDEHVLLLGKQPKQNEQDQYKQEKKRCKCKKAQEPKTMRVKP